MKLKPNALFKSIKSVQRMSANDSDFGHCVGSWPRLPIHQVCMGRVVSDHTVIYSVHFCCEAATVPLQVDSWMQRWTNTWRIGFSDAPVRGAEQNGKCKLHIACTPNHKSRGYRYLRLWLWPIAWMEEPKRIPDLSGNSAWPIPGGKCCTQWWSLAVQPCFKNPKMSYHSLRCDENSTFSEVA